MKVLVDTHAFFWWLTVDRKLSRRAHEALEDARNEVLVSAVVAWEIATKVRVGKWPGGEVVLEDLDAFVDDNELQPLPITIAHGRQAGSMRGAHRDPFDRILATQSRLEGAPLITADPIFQTLDVSVLW
jgi:PIN domain nuclease of toxin-antitoxin system